MNRFTFNHTSTSGLRVALLMVTACSALVAHGDEFPEVRNSPSEAHLSPLPAQEAAAQMKLPPGFRATVFAAEPDVQNPIAMAWDARGRLWIAENYTYSDRTQRFDLSHRDRVLVFADRDGDGRADERKVFVDNVQMLTSVEVGRGGVWLLCPPRLLFIPDANGDDVPDGPAQVMLDGFDVAQDNYHNFANGLRWGPDGWLYGRCGHSCPGRLGVPGTPDERRVPLDGGVWRFHPRRQVVEVLCHGTTNPWGHDWDEHGELFFINTVNGHLWHMLPGCHFKESFGESDNPYVYERLDTIADHYHYDTRRSWAESRGGKANDLGGGHAHIGAMIYQGSDWPQNYRGRLMTINMHGMRANVERLERHASGYVGRHEPDWFIAADPFFRGLDLSQGPDGNVFVIDWSDTGECHEHSGVHRKSGRIFKISYGPSRPARPVAKPWCLAGDGALPRLWADYQADKLAPKALRALEKSDDEHLRVWAIRLLTDTWPLDRLTGPDPRATYPDDAATYDLLLRLARDDSSGLVHRVLASTLQRLPVTKRAALAAELVGHPRYAQDYDLQLLLWYGVSPLAESSPTELATLGRRTVWPDLVRWTARALATQSQRDAQPLNTLLANANDRPALWQTAALKGMDEAYRGWRRAPRPASWESFVRLPGVASDPDRVRNLSTLFGDGRALDEIQRIVIDDKAELKSRQRALETLIEARPPQLRETCERLLDTRVLNATALRGLAQFDDPAIAQLLVKKYRRFQPSDRPLVIETLAARRAFATVLLDSLGTAANQIPRTEVTASQARQVVNLADEQLTRRLAETWGTLRDSSDEQRRAMERIKAQLTPAARLAADLSNGRALYAKTCANCHVLFGEGKHAGPDLTGSQRTNIDYLLSNVLDPSAVVGKEYRLSIFVLRDGRVVNGLVTSRTPRTIVVRTATEEFTFEKDQIDEIRESSLSLMPDGLLKQMTDEQVRDLLCYLMHPNQVPLPGGTQSAAP